MTQKKEIIQTIKGGLIVSCQALEGEPLYTVEGGVMPLLAQAAMEGGAIAIRANSVRDVVQIREKVALPIIGIIKKQYPPYEQYITVTMDEVHQLAEAKADIIALDCTQRERVDGKTVEQHLADLKAAYPQQLFMADISNYEEGIAAAQAGADLVSTTLNGYTKYTQPRGGEPDFELVKLLAETCGVPVIAEGNIHYPWQAKKMLDSGAWSVVVGGAITRPLEITKRFVEAINTGFPPSGKNVSKQ